MAVLKCNTITAILMKSYSNLFPYLFGMGQTTRTNLNGYQFRQITAWQTLVTILYNKIKLHIEIILTDIYCRILR